MYTLQHAHHRILVSVCYHAADILHLTLSLLLLALVTTSLFSVSMDLSLFGSLIHFGFAFYIPHVIEIIWHLSFFSAWSLPFSRIPLKICWCCKWQDFIFYHWVAFLCLCVYVPGIRFIFQHPFMSYPYFAFFFLYTHNVYYFNKIYMSLWSKLINFEQSRVNYRLINKNKQLKN